MTLEMTNHLHQLQTISTTQIIGSVKSVSGADPELLLGGGTNP